MNVSAPFIRRPVATALLAAAMLLAGTLAYVRLPVAPLPRVDFPTIQVQATLPGASPETMASSVATPLERRFGRIAGLSEMTSQSNTGSTSITMQFDLDKNVDAAARDVQGAIAAAGGELPPGLPFKPTYKKVNPADAPTMIISLTSDTLPLSEVFDAANTILSQKIAQVPGVGQVFVAGGQQPAVRVAFDPRSLAGMGVGAADLRGAIAANTLDEAKGSLSGEFQRFALGANDQLFGAKSYRPLVVARDGDASARLGDVAHVFDGVENERVAGWADAEPAVLLIVRKQPDANIIETNERVKALLPTLASFISPAIKVSLLSDRTQTIRASVEDVQWTLLLSIALVIGVVFAFLRSPRATLVPAVAVPLSLVGTFGIMWLCGYSIDNLSLMALTISTGFVVDDAIVVTENIARAIERGEPAMRAALDGAKEIGFTIISITLSLLAVFVPVLLMGGIVGRLFREFAVTLSVAVAVSALVSLTLTPVMCSRMLRPEHGPHGWAYRVSERAFEGLVAFYERGLRWALRHKAIMLLVTVGTVAANVGLFFLVPPGLFPQQDTGMLFGTTEAAQDVSFAEMRRLQSQVNEVLRSDPDVAHFASFLGSGERSSNTGNAFIELIPANKRKASAEQILGRLRGKLGKIAGVTTYLQSRQEVNVGARFGRTQYQYTMQDANLDELRVWAGRVLDAMRKLPQLKDVASDQQNSGLELDVVIDRDTAARLGITPSMVDDALYDAFGQRQVATTYTQLNEYRVVLEAAPAYRMTPDAIDGVYVKSLNGAAVPLRAFAEAKAAVAPLSVNHHGQFPAVTISFNLAPGVALGEAVKAIESAELAMHLPPSVHADFSGTAQAFKDSFANEWLLILAALATVYIVLGVLYESYLHPITILSTLPSAGIGALLALIVVGGQLDIIAIVGLLLLIGIVKKNAILMVDFAIDRRREGAPADEAILRAGIMRFRPILMTTFAALFGALPLALGTGLGSELRRPLGITIAGGLIASQLMSLYTTPVVYLALDRAGAWVRRVLGLRAPGTELKAT